jgi:4-hydroxy-tetrahydrodipicolinate synthase
MDNIFSSVITALVTPFMNDSIDFTSLDKIITHQINGGVKSIVIAGSTGEGTSLSSKEYHALIRAAVTYSKKINIITACNHSSTAKAIEMAQQAEKLGSQGLMLTTPYYNKPTQEGLYRHFKALHDATNLPIMLYSVPSRTGVDFNDENIFRLCELNRICAFKDAAGSLERPLRIRHKIGDRLRIFSGDDTLALAFNAQGCKGVVSVASNALPSRIVQIQNFWSEGNHLAALETHSKLIPLYQALCLDTNPIPIKYAMQVLGLCLQEVRPALCELSNANKLLLEAAMKSVLGN